MVVIDTSALIDAFCGQRRSLAVLTRLIESGERPELPAIALYEWLRGPRLIEELDVQEQIFPRENVLPFGAAEAAAAAALYRTVRAPRGREIDLAIAATAIVRDASLWTLNTADFADLPGLRLV